LGDDMSTTSTKDILLDAALMHVPFDGWSDTALAAALADTGLDATVAKAVFPRGPVDMALAYHARGDAQMLAALQAADLGDMRFRDRIAHAVRLRLEAVEDKELVRRGMTLFALPPYAADGARALWQTADHIWQALGDTSQDVNWYTKRATLSAVYSATVLYWLGDTSEDDAATWAFLDRRIDNVMQIESLKAKARANPALSRLLQGPLGLLGRIRAPGQAGHAMPGRWGGRG
jgi:ubiquinone biosynthesis protein COQ9